MGLLPVYSQAKEWATVLLILCRMAQGLSSGGELPGVFTHLYESDNTGGICKSVGFAICGAHVGASLGLLVVMATHACLSDDEMHAYGWRIPFLTNIVVGGVGIWIRRKLRNSSSFTAFSAQVAAGNAHSKTVKEIWLASWRPIVAMMLATGAWGPVFYVCFIWMTAYQHDIVDPNLKDARATTLVMLLLLAVLTPYAGGWVDRQVAGSKDMHRALSTWLLRAWAVLAVVSMPAFLLISRGDVFLTLLGQLMLVPSVAVAGSVTGALLASSFSISSRYVSTGITYNLGQCLFSSSSLVVVTAMAQDWATWTPGLYVSLVALTSAVALYAFQSYVADCRDANATAEEVRADQVKREAAPTGRRGRSEGKGVGAGAGEHGGDDCHLPSPIVNPMADLDSELHSPFGP
jgi:MHS family proline/betaine transporter-like MFS transporter